MYYPFDEEIEDEIKSLVRWGEVDTAWLAELLNEVYAVSLTYVTLALAHLAANGKLAYRMVGDQAVWSYLSW